MNDGLDLSPNARNLTSPLLTFIICLTLTVSLVIVVSDSLSCPPRLPDIIFGEKTLLARVVWISSPLVLLNG